MNRKCKGKKGNVIIGDEKYFFRIVGREEEEENKENNKKREKKEKNQERSIMRRTKLITVRGTEESISYSDRVW